MPIREEPADPLPKPFSSQQSESAGTVAAGDSISRLLKRPDLGAGLILLGLLTAFGLGAMHALSPGHGKTIVAAYLVGSRGTLRHALLLGSVVTFTHTVSVFLLGIGVLFFQRYVVPEKVIPILGAGSGLSIVCIGGYLLYKRLQRLSGTDVNHTHSHAQTEELESAWTGGEAHHALEFLPRSAKQRSFIHTHDGSTHSHIMPEDRVTIGSLVALGASGGLVPCPSALILLLSAIAVGHTALGLSLLVSFSVGLAAVLMGIGALVLYAKELLPDESRIRSHPAFRFVPVFSAVVVMILGVLMTMSSLGMVQALRFPT